MSTWSLEPRESRCDSSKTNSSPFDLWVRALLQILSWAELSFLVQLLLKVGVSVLLAVALGLVRVLSFPRVSRMKLALLGLKLALVSLEQPLELVLEQGSEFSEEHTADLHHHRLELSFSSSGLEI